MTEKTEKQGSCHTGLSIKGKYAKHQSFYMLCDLINGGKIDRPLDHLLEGPKKTHEHRMTLEKLLT